MSRQCFKIVIVVLSLREVYYVDRSERDLEPAPVSFTLPDEGNSKDLHTRRQDDYFLAVLEPARSVQFAS